METKVIVKTQTQMQELLEQLRTSTWGNENPEWQRNHWRITVDTLGMIEVENSTKGSEPLHISTHDLNAEGLGFLSHRQFIVGQKLAVNIHTEEEVIEIPATVVLCVKTIGMFHVGVKFNLSDTNIP